VYGFCAWPELKSAVSVHFFIAVTVQIWTMWTLAATQVPATSQTRPQSREMAFSGPSSSLFSTQGYHSQNNPNSIRKGPDKLSDRPSAVATRVREIDVQGFHADANGAGRSQMIPPVSVQLPLNHPIKKTLQHTPQTSQSQGQVQRGQATPTSLPPSITHPPQQRHQTHHTHNETPRWKSTAKTTRWLKVYPRKRENLR